MKDYALSKHFTREQLQCRCCGNIGPYPENLKKLIEKLEELWQAVKDKYKKPYEIHFNCAYRCPKHNAEVGGVSNSYHTQDMAADIWIQEADVDSLANLARKVGFGGIGRYYAKEFVHVDVGPVREWEE